MACDIFIYCSGEKKIHIAVKRNCDFKCNLNVYFFHSYVFSCKILILASTGPIYIEMEEIGRY